MIEIITNYVYWLWLAALLILPLITRRVLLWILLSLGAGHYKRQIREDTGRQWETAKDRMVLKGMTDILSRRLKGSFDLTSAMREDLYQLLHLIDHYCDETKPQRDQLEFHFSLKRLLQVSLMAFEETYELINQYWIFRFLQRRKVIWLERFLSYGQFYKKLINAIPLVKRMSQTPVPGFLLRLFLIPLLGIPSLIWYNLRTLLMGMLAEGSFRFFYVLIMMRIARYGLFLYGEPNKGMEEKLKGYSKKGIKGYYNKLSSELAAFEEGKKSIHYEQGLFIYQQLLEQWNLNLDTRYGPQKTNPKWSRWLDTWIPGKGSSEKNLLLFVKDLFLTLPPAYGHKGDQGYLHLRLGDFIRLGYRTSLEGIYFLLTTPGLQQASGLSVNMMFKLQSITRDPLVTTLFPKAKETLDHWKNYNKIRRALNFITRRRGVFSLAWSLGSPLLFDNIRKGFSSYLAHRWGRLLIMTWEERALHKNPGFNTYFEETENEKTEDNP